MNCCLVNLKNNGICKGNCLECNYCVSYDDYCPFDLKWKSVADGLPGLGHLVNICSAPIDNAHGVCVCEARLVELDDGRMIWRTKRGYEFDHVTHWSEIK